MSDSGKYVCRVKAEIWGYKLFWGENVQCKKCGGYMLKL